jgi:hypothetical protein
MNQKTSWLNLGSCSKEREKKTSRAEMKTGVQNERYNRPEHLFSYLLYTIIKIYGEEDEAN